MTAYFRQKALECDSSTVFVIVYGEETLLGSVPKSTHREADYRIISHIFDAISRGITMTTVYCNDTDIVVIILAFRPMLLQASPQIQVFIHHDSEVLNLNNMCANLGILKTAGCFSSYMLFPVVIIHQAFSALDRKSVFL